MKQVGPEAGAGSSVTIGDGGNASLCRRSRLHVIEETRNRKSSIIYGFL